MAPKTPQRKKTVARVMHAFKEGELEQRNGEPVKALQKAIAIALSEAGASTQDSPKTSREMPARTKRKRAGRTGVARSS